MFDKDDSDMPAHKQLARMLVGLTAGFIATKLAEAAFDKFFVEREQLVNDTV